MTGGLGAFVRRHDPDRFFCSLFAPARERELLFTLYAFNHELARAGEVAREPMMALIRLQWWREVVEGARRAHEVAGPVGAAVDDGALTATLLLPLIEAREAEPELAEGGLDRWRDYLLAGPGGLAVAAGSVLGADEAESGRLRRLGAGYGAAGLLSAPGGRLCPSGVPRPVLAAEGRRLLAAGAGRFRRPVIAAALPAVLARHARRGGIGARLDVVRAALTGRIGAPVAVPGENH